ncbi:MAG: hypothetical protein OXG69_13040 [bacterium]|nr:hypothetical protein [bacterium]
MAVVELLAEHGPGLDRPHADRVRGSKYHNMKELRPEAWPCIAGCCALPGAVHLRSPS